MPGEQERKKKKKKPPKPIQPGSWGSQLEIKKKLLRMEGKKDLQHDGGTGAFKHEGGVLLHFSFDIQLRDGHAGCRSSESIQPRQLLINFLAN